MGKRRALAGERRGVGGGIYWQKLYKNCPESSLVKTWTPEQYTGCHEAIGHHRDLGCNSRFMAAEILVSVSVSGQCQHILIVIGISQVPYA